MNFVSFDQLCTDATAWEKQLPVFDAVVGIPRSGLVPATIIALKRNIRMLDYGDFLENPMTAMQKAIVRKINPLVLQPYGKRILVVDDSSGRNSGTIKDLRHRLAGRTGDLEISYGVVYAEIENAYVDYCFKLLAKPRFFEWNLIRHDVLTTSVCDMDGVLCEDWTGTEVDDDPEYMRHLTSASPFMIPQRPILGIVTGRLEKYRQLTVDWLARHNVNYGFLEMHPGPTPSHRRARNDVWQRKAATYASLSNARLFIESSEQQAKCIHEKTDKPVLCSLSMTLFGNKYV